MVGNYIVFQLSTGKEIGRLEMGAPTQEKLDNRLALVSQGSGIILSDLTLYLADESTPSPAIATVENGEIVNVAEYMEPCIYAHVTLTGGDGAEPIGLANSGTDWRIVQVAVALRQGPKPTDPLVEVSQAWRMRLRDDQGQVRHIKRVALTSGQAGFEFSVADGFPPGDLRLSEQDFEQVQGNQVKLAQPVRLIIFEP